MPQLDDDFILTISDNDEDVPDYDGEEEGLDDSKVLDMQSNGAKRKRDTRKPSSAKKKQKLDGTENKLDIAQAVNGVDGKDDHSFDPDFEFVLDEGGTLLKDGWDFALERTSKRSTMGVDEIIERRRKARQEEDQDNEEHDMVQLEEEEALADDAFGMTIDEDEIEDDEEGHGNEEEDDINLSDQDIAHQQAHTENEVDTDSSSNPEPVPHPLDLEADNIESESEQEDAEMVAKRAAFYAPEDGKDDSSALKQTQATFQSMSLSRPILKGLTSIGFSTPTPIQAKTVPVALLGKDLVGGAETGSGKTAAFIIPILERLLFRSKKVPTTRVGILMPTRELAVQCFNVATKLASFTDITFALIVGGLSLREQEATLKKRPDVVIATPGRFIDHMRNTASFVVENLEILVLDEADRMLEDGFADELNQILTTIPRSRQTMLFSATMTEDVDKLIRVGLQRPVRLMVDAKRKTVSGLIQEFIRLKPTKAQAATQSSKPSSSGDEPQRLAILLHLLRTTYTSRTIIFVPRKTLAHHIKILISLLLSSSTTKIQAVELHGSMSQEQRLSAIAAFRDGTATHLLATDLASRGLDIPVVDTVINLTVPPATETYLHRVGRTARAGRRGVSCTIFSSSASKQSSKGTSKGERSLLRPILKLAKSQRATMRTRSVPPDAISTLVAQIADSADEIEAIMAEEKEEKLLAATERDVVRGENLVLHEAEIAGRPRRTWFQTEKEKNAAKERGREERMGVDAATALKDKKKKLSGKDKKKLASKDERRSGSGWKKGKEERMGRGTLQAAKDRRVEKRRVKKAKR